MIGKIVEHIIQTGYDVSIYQYENALMLRIVRKAAIGEGIYDGKVCAINWVLSRQELAQIVSDEILMEVCKDKLRLLQ